MMTPSLNPRCAQSPAISLGPIFPTMLKSMRFAQQAHSQDHRVEETRRRHPVKYAISDAAWLDPSPCPKTSPNAWSTEESTPCALSTKIEPDSRGSSQGVTSRVPPSQHLIALLHLLRIQIHFAAHLLELGAHLRHPVFDGTGDVQAHARRLVQRRGIVPHVLRDLHRAEFWAAHRAET